MHEISLSLKMDFKACVVEENFARCVHDARFCLFSMAGNYIKPRGLSCGPTP